MKNLKINRCENFSILFYFVVPVPTRCMLTLGPVGQEAATRNAESDLKVDAFFHGLYGEGLTMEKFREMGLLAEAHI